MNNYSFTFFCVLLFSILLSSCGDDPAETDMIPDSYFSWNIDGEKFEGSNTARYAYTSGPNFVILGESGVGTAIIISLDNSNGHPGQSGKTFDMNNQTLDEVIYEDVNENRLSSINPGGSATLNMTLYQEFEDATFTSAFVEGTFSGILTSTTDTTIYVIENGTFGVKEN